MKTRNQAIAERQALLDGMSRAARHVFAKQQLLGLCGQPSSIEDAARLTRNFRALLCDPEHWVAWERWAASRGDALRARAFAALIKHATRNREGWGTPSAERQAEARAALPVPPPASNAGGARAATGLRGPGHKGRD